MNLYGEQNRECRVSHPNRYTLSLKWYFLGENDLTEKGEEGKEEDKEEEEQEDEQDKGKKNYKNKKKVCSLSYSIFVVSPMIQYLMGRGCVEKRWYLVGFYLSRSREGHMKLRIYPTRLVNSADT